MHDLIIQCLNRRRTVFESPEMCHTVLTGGFEKFAQAILGYELYVSTQGSILTERNRTDFLGQYHGVLTAIEMGVNALCNPRERGVINHIVDDTNKALAGHRANRVFTISVVDSMASCNHHNHLPLVKYRNRYPLPIIETERQTSINNIIRSDQFFGNPSLQTVNHIIFSTAAFEGYRMELLFFICGPFTQQLQKWWE